MTIAELQEWILNRPSVTSVRIRVLGEGDQRTFVAQIYTDDDVLRASSGCDAIDHPNCLETALEASKAGFSRATRTEGLDLVAQLAHAIVETSTDELNRRARLVCAACRARVPNRPSNYDNDCYERWRWDRVAAGLPDPGAQKDLDPEHGSK